MNVKGEEHLWSHRPAVFVFNHQSKADVMIMTRLLRRDIAGVGKKEIRDMPVIGQVMEAGGVVMIDRENSSSAIEAMQPLVDVMRKDGKSVVLAPEGTRTISPRLNPFKKGAFHLAMQAGVPIVPVVIRNAGDVAPKGDFVFRPATVEVEVLPPVDTSQWSTATLADHVREVRNMFLTVLGQPLEAVTKPAAKSKRKQSATKSAAKVTSKKTAKKTTKKTSENSAADKTTKAAVKKAATRKTASKRRKPGPKRPTKM